MTEDASTSSSDQATAEVGRQPRYRFRLSEGVALFLAPIVAVLCTFAYEAGYLFWYGVPYWIVRLDVTHVLVTATAAVALFAVVYNYLLYVPIISPWRVLVVLLILPLASILFGLVAVPSLKWTWRWLTFFQVLWIVAWVGGGCYLFYSFLIKPILSFKDKSWEDRWLRKATEVFKKKDINLQQHLHSRVDELFGPALSTAIVLTAIALLTLYFWGYHRAGAEKVHYLLRLPEPCLTVRRYADGLVCVDVDTMAWRLRPSFRILPFVDFRGDISAITAGPILRATLLARTSSPASPVKP